MRAQSPTPADPGRGLPPPARPRRDILGHGVVTSDGPVWKAKRQLLNPAFHFTALERLQVTCFDQATARLM